MKNETLRKIASWVLQFILLFEILTPGILSKFRPEMEKPAAAFYMAVIASCLLLYAIAGNQIKAAVKSEASKELQVYTLITLIFGLMWLFTLAYMYFKLP